MTTQDELVPKSTGLKKGDTGADVERLQNYLSQFGYLESPVLDEFGVDHAMAQEEPEHGTFDDRTEEALRTFQEHYDLPVTGKLNKATRDLMTKPRCGFPDTAEPVSAEFVAQGNKWSTTTLRYGFVEFTPDLSQAQVRAAVSTAFGYWAAVTPLTFGEIPNASNPEIRIRFAAGNHGDGSPFDGPGGVLAHAYYPPPNGGDIAGDTHFDEAETWTVSLPATGIDLYTVAAHEFGHALGLAHSTVSGALMYPYYGGPHRFLHQDDIDGIQSIYGAQQWMTKTLARVYTTPHSKNAWAYPTGVGWRKVAPTSTDGVTNTFAALVQARASDKPATMLVTGTEITSVYF
ncbi:matrixin family metalloprotease [Ornithinimicrobium sediminis]|uniref:matrixin family metalloprotease n=1 Tax=Ornithinimicrobium sediminis TaxID=2904603 RepID=UPI001E5F8573|nr:matrixin family metalloprotease [Ornithinimicrobium sediminis]MCE0486834.1 matrixin family metalloprotease [Ornithinimicrobium sediminis]